MRGRNDTVPDKVAEKLMVHFQDGWKQLFGDGEKMQQEVLAEIIELGSDSDYAKDHGFAGISTREEFEAKVPISDYEDYRKYIEDNMNKDDGQLISLDTDYYLLTTGTTGQAKYFAETKVGALARQLSIDIWNMALSQSVKAMRDPDVKMLAVVNCAPLDEAANGKRVKRASGQAGKVLWERAGQMYVFPYEFLEAEMSESDKDYLMAAYTLKEGGFSMLFCNNMAYFGILLDLIETRPQQMINDIRNGYMTAELKDEDRKLLSSSFKADEGRAKELQELLDEYGYLPLDKIWPKFIFVGTWLPGSAGRLAKDVRRRLPENVLHISEGYGASEAMLNIPMEFDKPYGALAPYAYYYEFLPLGSDKPLPMSEVINGEYYELIITTYSGLYRYNMKDIVRIQGFTGTTANIEFCCKSTDVCNICGRNIYGYELTDMIKKAEEKMGCLLSFYQGFAEEDRLSVVIQPYEKDFDIKRYYEYLKEVMKSNGIAIGKMYVMKQNYYHELFQAMMTNGRNMQCLKLPLIMSKAPQAELILEIYED